MRKADRAKFPFMAPITRLSIGTRLFLILAIALLPLALGAVVANRSLADTARDTADSPHDAASTGNPKHRELYTDSTQTKAVSS